MPADFAEKSGLVWSVTDWGRWSQTVHGLVIQVQVVHEGQGDDPSTAPMIKSKEIQVDVTAKKVKCVLRGKVIFEVFVLVEVSFLFFRSIVSSISSL